MKFAVSLHDSETTPHIHAFIKLSDILNTYNNHYNL